MGVSERTGPTNKSGAWSGPTVGDGANAGEVQQNVARREPASNWAPTMVVSGKRREEGRTTRGVSGAGRPAAEE